MTLHDPRSARKPPRRFWLYAPYVALLIGIIGWSVFWVWARGAVADRMDAAAREMRDAGYILDWKSRRIEGYPFRVGVTLEGVRFAEPSGWAVVAPVIKAETYAYELDHWVGFAPSGVALNRPLRGPLSITGPALRASYVHTGPGAPRIAIEGSKLVFTPGAGAKPFVLAGAEHLDFHSRPADGGGVEFLLRIDNASSPARSVLNSITQGKPMAIAWEGKLSNLKALRGRDWPTAARAWTAAGGGLDVEHGALSAGVPILNLRPGRLTLDQDGKLRGTLGLDLVQAPNVIRILSQARMIDPSALDAALTVAQVQTGGVTRADLTFLSGAAAFGPVAVGPSPRLY